MRQLSNEMSDMSRSAELLFDAHVYVDASTMTKDTKNCDQWSMGDDLSPIQVFPKRVVVQLYVSKQRYSLYMLEKHL